MVDSTKSVRSTRRDVEPPASQIDLTTFAGRSVVVCGNNPDDLWPSWVDDYVLTFSEDDDQVTDCDQGEQEGGRA